MKLEDQLVSLDLAKELKEAGYPQEGAWWWVKHNEYSKDDGVHLGYSDFYVTRAWLKGTKEAKKEFADIVFIPTVAELLDARRLTTTIYGSTRKVADFLAREWLNDKR